MSYIVAGMIVYNEEVMIRYSLGSIYDYVDQVIIIDSYSTDKTVQQIFQNIHDGKQPLNGIDTDKKTY